MNLRCSMCQRTYPVDTREWRCECGGIFELDEVLPFLAKAIRSDIPSVWRYRAMLPIKDEEAIVSLGEGFTPLVPVQLYGLSVLCKPEFLAPTSSFKDRGTSVLVTAMGEMGVTEAVDDSSGNAAASLAAYCARAGIPVRIFAPAYTSPAKLAQIAVYGAELELVEGPRQNSAVAAQEAAKAAYYASHNYNPFFAEGTKTFAYEVWEHLGQMVPHNVIFPVGNGGLLMGTYRGFMDLKQAELIERLPRLFAVQAEACAPLYAAFLQGLEEPPSVTPGETIAEGIRSARPSRGVHILRAIRETGGAALAVGDQDIQEAQDVLARQGLYVEPTSAVAGAALRKLGNTIGPDEITVVALTGSGLKSVPKG
jgi:threonine synthase